MLTKGAGSFPVLFGFAGAYDAIPSIAAAYGMRRLRTAYTGSLLRVRRSSDNTEQDIGYIANGDLDTVTVATFIGGGSGYVVKWYDQSGNAYDASQTTAAYQPLYVASGQNGKPVGRWDGANDNLASAAMSITQPYSLMIVAGPNVDRVRYHYILRNSSADTGGLWRVEQTTGRQLSYAGSTFFSTGATDGWHIRSFLMDGAASGMWIDTNSQGTGNVGAGSISAITIGKSVASLLGDIAELIICNAALSDANRQAAEAAANAYWAVY